VECPRSWTKFKDGQRSPWPWFDGGQDKLIFRRRFAPKCANSWICPNSATRHGDTSKFRLALSREVTGHRLLPYVLYLHNVHCADHKTTYEVRRWELFLQISSCTIQSRYKGSVVSFSVHTSLSDVSDHAPCSVSTVLKFVGMNMHQFYINLNYQFVFFPSILCVIVYFMCTTCFST